MSEAGIRVFQALDRGELVPMLANLDAGRLAAEDFMDGWEKWQRKHWLRNLVATLFLGA